MPSPSILTPELLAQLERLKLELVLASDQAGFLEKADVVSIPSWPEFMMNDAVANRYWRALNERHAAFQFALVERESGNWIAVGNSIPVHFSGPLENLPDKGWDWALLTGMESSETPNLLCALAIQILPDHRGGGLSTLMIKIMKAIGHAAGLDQLIAPVRPNKKCDYPLIPMEAYVEWSRADERFDPWLRVHQRLDARILKVCPEAMRIVGSIPEWEAWTGLSFQTSGEYIIPGALNPITIDMDRDEGLYIEPNVWMLHH